MSKPPAVRASPLSQAGWGSAPSLSTLAAVSTRPQRQSDWGPALSTSTPTAVATRPRRWMGRGSVLRTSASIAVAAGPHRQLVWGPALPTSMPAAIMAQPQQGGTLSPHKGYFWSIWLWCIGDIVPLGPTIHFLHKARLSRGGDIAYILNTLI